jgi:hypothetical protein
MHGCCGSGRLRTPSSDHVINGRKHRQSRQTWSRSIRPRAHIVPSCEGSDRVIESAELIGRWPLVKVRCAIEEPTVAAL